LDWQAQKTDFCLAVIPPSKIENRGNAMAVAVKPSPESTTTRPLNPLAVGSLLGIVYVLGSLYFLLYVLPDFWYSVLGMDATSFVDVALLLGAILVAGAGLAFVGAKLAGSPPRHGLKAGIAVGIVLVFFATLATQAVGITLEKMGLGLVVGGGLTVACGVFLLYLIVRSYFRPNFDKWLQKFEDQGWFSLTSYKRSQGMRVRRGTILGILALVGCGIYTMLHRNPLLGDWELGIPFVDDWTLVLLPARKYTLTLLFAAAGLWFAWRIVNYPTFADFLIATEAEMNKVSWTTRRRLVQDTIVVLTTVFLLTIFLLIVDVLWFKILSNPYLHVLRINTTQQTTGAGSERIEW
jgi:preprotein translocase SecE subunit